jgi:hypothetical protein
MDTCTPKCGEAECGDDGCGGTCGKCPAAAPVCVQGFCQVSCSPDCEGAACGDDGCGGSCGTCADGATCVEGACQTVCAPQCGGKSCGPDGCGGTCGECGAGTVCTPGGTCTEASGDEITAECEGVCTGATKEAVLCATELCWAGVGKAQVSSPTGDTITKAWSALEWYGNKTNDLGPKHGGSYAVFVTGPVQTAEHSVDLSGGGSKPDPFKAGSTTYDHVLLSVELTAPEGVQGFAFDSVFLSVEFYEWVGSEFNDRFYAILNAPKTTGGKDVVINATACSSPQTYSDFTGPGGEKMCYMGINTVYAEKCPGAPTDIGGTGFACPAQGADDKANAGSSTGWLTTTWPIEAGETFTLQFLVLDTADGIYDSGFILDHFRWLTATPTKQTTPSK